jgi:hypothetical protein
MGTSAGAGNFRNNDATAIDANSWQRLDEVPMTSNADYVRQQTNSATSYVELGLQDMTATCSEVSAVLAYHAAGTAADIGKTSIFDGPTESVVFRGDMSQTALQYLERSSRAGGGHLEPGCPERPRRAAGVLNGLGPEPVLGLDHARGRGPLTSSSDILGAQTGTAAAQWRRLAFWPVE